MKDKLFILRMNTIYEKNPLKTQLLHWTLRNILPCWRLRSIFTHMDCTSVQNLDHLRRYTRPLADCAHSWLPSRPCKRVQGFRIYLSAVIYQISVKFSVGLDDNHISTGERLVNCPACILMLKILCILNTLYMWSCKTKVDEVHLLVPCKLKCQEWTKFFHIISLIF